MYICVCHAVSDKEIRAAVERGAETLGDVAFELGVGTNCGCCRQAAEQLINECSRCTQASRCHARRSSASVTHQSAATT